VIAFEPVASRWQKREFDHLSREVYRDWPQHRDTEEDVLEMLVHGRSVYQRHAQLDPFLIKEGRRTVGRFVLVQDERLPEYVQISFFEALPGLDHVLDAIELKARATYPCCPKLVVGLHAHLNYGAGFLASRFDEPPLFGLPFTPPYYLNYFERLEKKWMSSFRFDARPFFKLRRAMAELVHPEGISVRTMDRRFLSREVDIYTYLNNACFQEHPYWANRSAAEDWELFYPFRFFLREENLLIAECEGKPVGFLLWYPDFNELVGPGQRLGPIEVARYWLRNPIKAVRLTEVAILPDFKRRGVVEALALEMARYVEMGGFSITEGGFIFDDNQASIKMTMRLLEKAMGQRLESYRKYCVFEGPL
jgi:ribosomal protein S18 acetylase RimI-like enzyme